VELSDSTDVNAFDVRHVGEKSRLKHP